MSKPKSHKDGPMKSACGEYECPCHEKLKTERERVIKIVKGVLEFNPLDDYEDGINYAVNTILRKLQE